MISIALHRLFVSQWTGYSFILGHITVFVANFFNVPLLYPIGFVLMTNAFDLIGYGQIMQPIYDYNKSIPMGKTVLQYEAVLYYFVIPYYRIIQKLYNWVLVVTIWSITGNWIIALGCLCSNFGGFQDLLYYIFGRYNLNQNYTWLRWTPLGMLIGDLNKWEFIGQGIISFTLIIISVWRLI